MDRFKFNPSVLPSVTLTSDVGGLVSFDDVVKVENINGYNYATQSLTEYLAEIPTANSIAAQVTTTGDSRYVKLSDIQNVLADNLKTVNSASLVGTGNITVSGGSGSSSSVSVTADYKTGLKIGSVNETNIYVPYASGSTSGVINLNEYTRIYSDPYIGYAHQGVVNSASAIDDYISISAFDYGSNRCAYIQSFTLNSTRYAITLKLMNVNSSRIGMFTAEGPIEYGANNKFSINTTGVYRKYLINVPASGSKTVKLLYSSDMFNYNTSTNTLSITTE